MFDISVRLIGESGYCSDYGGESKVFIVIDDRVFCSGELVD